MELKRKARTVLLGQFQGLLSALELPNSLNLNKIERYDLSEKLNAKFEFNSSNYFLTLKNIQKHFFKTFQKLLGSRIFYLTSPYLVRPALIEVCNLNSDNIPVIHDGQNNKLCVAG